MGRLWQGGLFSEQDAQNGNSGDEIMSVLDVMPKKKCFMEIKELDGTTTLIRLDHISKFSTWTNEDMDPTQQVQLLLACGQIVNVDPADANRLRDALVSMS